MAIALVRNGTTANVSSGTTISPAFGQATSAGNLLTATLSSGSGGPGGWTVDQGWTIVQTPTGFAYKANCGAGETAPIFTNGAAITSPVWCQLQEWSGADSISPLDQSSQNALTTSPVTSTNPSADAGAGELILACCYDILTKAGTCTTADPLNNGATPINLDNNDATSLVTHFRFTYGFTTGNSAADSNAHTNDSMNINNLTVAITSFKVASAQTQTFFTQQGALRNDPDSLQSLAQTVARGALY